MISIQVDLGGLERYRTTFTRDLRFSTNGPIRRAIWDWSDMYRSWLRTRFSRYSRGGGTWPPLAERTIKRKGHARILRDTDTLFGALDTDFGRKPGYLNRQIPFGVITGFGATGTHPKAHMSIDQLAEIHQLGLGVVPARPIIVQPSAGLQAKMAARMERGIRELGDTTGVS